MRTNRMNGWVGEFHSSFLSCEKDTETIIRKLLVDSKPYSDELKRLLLINTKDCLDDRTNTAYLQKIKNTSIADLRSQGYLKLEPKLELGENEEVKNYILITFDNFTSNANDEYYRDNIIMIDVISHIDYWDIGNYRIRPLKIAGYVDGILNHARLSGIGTLQFMGCNEIVMSENFAGYCLMYRAIHGVEDILPEAEDE